MLPTLQSKIDNEVDLISELNTLFPVPKVKYTLDEFITDIGNTYGDLFDPDGNVKIQWENVVKVTYYAWC